MKSKILPCLLCVIFVFISNHIGVVYAFSPEQIEFSYKGKVFEYALENNIKTSGVFSVDHDINKYNRFGPTEERIALLNNLLNLGFDKDVALEYMFPNLLSKINSISKNIYIQPQNAKLNINTNLNSVFKISNETVGIIVDKEKLIDDILKCYLQKKELLFTIPTKTIYPQTTKKDLEKFTNLRADFSTDISSSSLDRKHNVKNALASLNKVEILPNEIFSFNKTVGRRTAENGYRQAKIIINDEFVDGIGGGVCQVSSTLYNAALLSGLEIVEANKHSKQVGYIKHGFDAMVNFGTSDLKFKNNTNEKITIITNFSSTQARIRIYGENMGTTQYKLKNEVFNIVQPIEEVYVDEEFKHLDKVKYDDEYFYLKKASKGMEIKSYREKYVNNQLVSTELLRHDKYKAQNSIKIYGKGTRFSNNSNLN